MRFFGVRDEEDEECTHASVSKWTMLSERGCCYLLASASLSTGHRLKTSFAPALSSADLIEAR